MQNDSIEALLLRHYGNTAPTPPDLEDRLLASVRLEAGESRKQQQAVARLHQERVSRRRAFRLLARGTGKAGLNVLSLGLDGLQALETTLSGLDVTTTTATPRSARS